MRFEGHFDIEGGDFELEAKPIILRDDELSFTLIGRDEFGAFRLDGSAKKTEHGFFLASRIPLIYPDYDINDYEEYATVRFDEVTPNSNMSNCKISGVWKQIQGDEWKFDGVIISSISNT